MARAFEFDAIAGGELHRIGHDCSGHQPWLGRIDGPPGQCGQYLRVVQRGASNVYFPVIRSAIYLPLWAENTHREIVKILEMQNVWQMLTAGLDDGKFIQNVRCEAVASIYRVSAEELRLAAQRKLDGDAEPARDETEEEFRRHEYEAIKSCRGGAATDLLVEDRPVPEYGVNFSRLFSRVCLVRKLRETRVLAGFSRLLPIDENNRQTLAPLARSGAIRWLPGIVVRGEGIFLELNSDAISAWATRRDVRPRIATLDRAYNRRRIERGISPRDVSPKLILLHALAHILIAQLSFDCGYGSASLRERIYCDSGDSDEPMQGILIYTASGDSEGTLGGLVRQGEPDRLVECLTRAVSRSQWCSSDPVCIESSGQGNDGANLAACHGCILLPETCCEEGNRLLDRAAIVGTPEKNHVGYFDAFF